ncbi:MAG: hypothetical protein HOK98_09895 [Rhodospirillaceae bacterium]|jgi:uncharacterized membrane protein|nr:hypothetical protein [Rhodospirillaceae bacterium]MBT5944820.1 hypothetical protein [Rhodospirillaceae bacterium]MBT6404043.1 hypothetical protein [Rhodospirillaceae bacterium]MBT6536485.1 hypothetical protein [Rhodospirillaceae bacterium]
MEFDPFLLHLIRVLHVISGVMWIGLLWYLNFVQVPTMPKIPDEMKPAIGKHIAPAVLFWFRWGAASTVLFGLLLAWTQGQLGNWLAIGLTDGGLDSAMIGIAMWFGLIMAFNVWFVIWPNQKIALGIVGAPAEAKPKSARRAMLFSRTNTLLSIPMLYGMVAAQNMPF